ncbi:ankyrin repeat domain-containing protein [Parapedobacter koreensis]|uniref:Ankyrin repeat-containing protein n=1 Tax=Parapedobacter koreensis TaxID=332977 RepID=A0A1H7R0P8_9SPHI|nr:ankyrin repeat domain-containing protein [Parapedobacter koreensis]SEL53504.1 Ankyrin repeat-containing protein [Parapedobacter koreensis]
MNNFIKAIKRLDFGTVEALLHKEPKWISWAEDSGKNALHYLCGVAIGNDKQLAADSLRLLKLLLDSGMDYNSIHQIADPNCDFFPATPLWYAYAKGRNETLYRYLLEQKASPENCLWAIIWNDDVEAAELFKKHGAKISDSSGVDTFVPGAFHWRRFRIAKWLLENGADVHAIDPEGNTALHIAVNRKFKLEHIALLLRFGANPHRENKAGISPRALAQSGNRKGVQALFNPAATT